MTPLYQKSVCKREIQSTTSFKSQPPITVQLSKSTSNHRSACKISTSKYRSACKISTSNHRSACKISTSNNRSDCKISTSNHGSPCKCQPQHHRSAYNQVSAFQSLLTFFLPNSEGQLKCAKFSGLREESLLKGLASLFQGKQDKFPTTFPFPTTF